MSEKQMRLLGWRPLRQGRLYGFAQVELPIGLILEEIPLLRGPEGLWAAMPSKVELNRDGRTVRTGGDGKPLYHSIARWKSRQLSSAFSQRLVALVRAAHPDDLE
jgi:DNA-binding cell septation regulator SpoVG